MRTADCYAELAERWTRELVVCALGSSTKEWYTLLGERDRSFHMHAMGMASSFGLGLALSRPSTPVWILDSDGGLCMNLGSLLTAAHSAPPNLVHFVLNNTAYLTIGGGTLVNNAATRYADLASAAGISNVYSFDDLDAFRGSVDELLSNNEPTFVELKVEPRLDVRPAVPYEGPEIKYRFGRHVEQQEGVEVFGPYGF